MRGSVTVFFSLIFVTVVSVLGATIESARWACAKLYCKQAVEDSIRSVFGDYYRPLFEEYGVLFLDENYGQEESMIIPRTEKYLLYNMKPNYGNVVTRSFLYNGKVSGFEVKEKLLATDGYGSVFRMAAYNYMKYRIPANFVEKFLEQYDFINQTKNIKVFFDDIQDIQKDLTKIDETIIAINNIVNDAKQMQQAIWDLQSGLNELLETGKEDKDRQKLIEEQKEALLANKAKVVECVEEALKNVRIYETVTGNVKEYLQGLADEWLSKKDISQNIKNIVREEIDSLLKYSAGEGDIYGVERSGDILEILSEDIHLWATSYTSGWLSALNDIEIIIDREDVMTDEFATNFDAKALWEEFKSQKLYSLICPEYEKLSEATISPFDNRAYANERAEKYESGQGVVSVVIEDIVFQEYIKQMFGSYVEPKENTAIKYEMEYIICGNRTDKDNIDSIINRLIATREILNLAHILGDSGKKNEAYSLAASCLGFTGVFAAVKALQYLILTVWAFGEALIDVRILMTGGSVPVMKGAGDWNTDLKSLLDMGNALYSIKAPKKESGIGDWGYSDYIKLFLYTQNRDEQVLRAMDIVEANMQKNYSATFKITNCIHSVKMQAQFSLPPLFGVAGLFDRACDVNFRYSY